MHLSFFLKTNFVFRSNFGARFQPACLLLHLELCCTLCNSNKHLRTLKHGIHVLWHEELVRANATNTTITYQKHVLRPREVLNTEIEAHDTEDWLPFDKHKFTIRNSPLGHSQTVWFVADLRGPVSQVVLVNINAKSDVFVLEVSLHLLAGLLQQTQLLKRLVYPLLQRLLDAINHLHLL